LRALDSRTQITRHDCVEGWSAIGKWKGAKLSALLDGVKVKPEARYVVFYCADPMSDEGKDLYTRASTWMTHGIRKRFSPTN
jgi:DMSO/TMAO reductase YedYZ molybdopterin-dependent catalytic subunit